VTLKVFVWEHGLDFCEKSRRRKALKIITYENKVCQQKILERRNSPTIDIYEKLDVELKSGVIFRPLFLKVKL
jgi:hypothetical protein